MENVTISSFMNTNISILLLPYLTLNRIMENLIFDFPSSHMKIFYLCWVHICVCLECPQWHNVRFLTEMLHRLSEDKRAGCMSRPFFSARRAAWLFGVSTRLFGVFTWPFGVATRLLEVATWPFGVTNRPFGMTTRPFGVTTRPFGVITRPFGVTARPFGVTAWPFRVATWPFGVFEDKW